MAQLPSDDEIREHQAQTAQEEDEKRKAQEAEGKEFVNNGQGVIPESEWEKFKEKK